MNERTIQLYKQAVDFAYTTAGKDAGKGTIIESLTAGKFAELIVKECARVFESEVDTWKQMDPYQGSIKRKGTKAIREYFGVEE